jgi:hypothetical protein
MRDILKHISHALFNHLNCYTIYLFISILWSCHIGDHSQGNLPTFDHKPTMKVKFSLKYLYILATCLNNVWKQSYFILKYWFWHFFFLSECLTQIFHGPLSRLLFFAQKLKWQYSTPKDEINSLIDFNNFWDTHFSSKLIYLFELLNPHVIVLYYDQQCQLLYLDSTSI